MQAESGGDTVWRRVPGWVHRVVDEEVLLLRSGVGFESIGGMATAVWLVLDQPATGDEIQNEITRRWPERAVDPAMAVETIDILHREGMIEPGMTSRSSSPPVSED